MSNMTPNTDPTLEAVKQMTGITGTYQDATIQGWIGEVRSFLLDAGVKEHNITPGIIARGVMDLWDYGSGTGQFSQYFMQRAAQLSWKQ